MQDVVSLLQTVRSKNADLQLWSLLNRSLCWDRMTHTIYWLSATCFMAFLKVVKTYVLVWRSRSEKWTKKRTKRTERNST